MASTLLYRSSASGIGLMGGLDWRVLPSGASTDVALREMGQDRAATHAVTVLPPQVAQATPTGNNRAQGTSTARVLRQPMTNAKPSWLARLWPKRASTHASASPLGLPSALSKQSTQGTQSAASPHPTGSVARTSAGFFSSIDGLGPGRKTHSLAAAFGLWMREHPEALLCYEFGQSEDSSMPLLPGTCAVVVVLGGQPVVDKVVASSDEAHAIAVQYLQQYPSISVVSNNSVRYPSTLREQGILTALAGACNKSTLLKPLPIHTQRWLLLALLVVLAVFAAWYYQRVLAEKERQARWTERQAQDPARLYLHALQQKAPLLGVARAQLLQSWQTALALPTQLAGWSLQQAACQVHQGCSARYERGHGTIEGFKAALLAQRLPFELETTAKPPINLQQLRLVWRADLQTAGLSSPIAAPPRADFVQGQSAALLQTWMVAGLKVQLKEPQLWPQVPGVPPGFKHAAAVALGDMEVAGIALPLVPEVLSTAPNAVIWQSWQLQLSNPPGSARSAAGRTSSDLAAAVTLKGVFYVQQ